MNERLTLTIEHDHFTESPLEYSPWEMHSFNTQHVNFTHPDEFFPADIGLRRKLECGTAFVLSYFEHGQCEWGLQGEACQCPWDTAQVAGILIYNEDVKYLPKGYKKRAEMACAILNEYTQWCNGECYSYSIEKEILCDNCGNVEDTEIVDCCGGFIGFNWMVEHLKGERPELFEDDATFEVKGAAGDLWQYAV